MDAPPAAHLTRDARGDLNQRLAIRAGHPASYARCSSGAQRRRRHRQTVRHLGFGLSGMSGIRGTAERRVEKRNLRKQGSFSYHALQNRRASELGFWLPSSAAKTLFGSPLSRRCSLDTHQAPVRYNDRFRNDAWQPELIQARGAGGAGLPTCSEAQRAATRELQPSDTGRSGGDAGASSAKAGDKHRTIDEKESKKLSRKAADDALAARNVSDAAYARICVAELRSALDAIQKRCFFARKPESALGTGATEFCARLAARIGICVSQPDCRCLDVGAVSAERPAQHEHHSSRNENGGRTECENWALLVRRFHRLIREWLARRVETAPLSAHTEDGACGPTDSMHPSRGLMRFQSDALTDASDPDNGDEQENATTPGLHPIFHASSLSSKAALSQRSMPAEPEIIRHTLAVEADIQDRRKRILQDVYRERERSAAFPNDVLPASRSSLRKGSQQGAYATAEHEDELIHALEFLRSSISEREAELEMLTNEQSQLEAMLQELLASCAPVTAARVRANIDSNGVSNSTSESRPRRPVSSPQTSVLDPADTIESNDRRRATCSAAAELERQACVPTSNTRQDDSDCPESADRNRLHPRCFSEPGPEELVSQHLEREKAEQRAAMMLQLLFASSTSPSKTVHRRRHVEMVAIELVTSMLALKPSGAIQLSGDDDEMIAIEFLEMHGLVRSQRSNRCLASPTATPDGTAKEYFFTEPASNA
ncbi:hypothetical protein CYME_CMK032C [Cyanidioschyzon merolae strain 10D]|uniref:Uncharacterized protein n=1 Tax=Cyanidioschyzon merolae (strain NIES-3377 / 10D) TaxID=280699 RepID=M1VCR9_CYAM1|nr:hypothetical protein CYME_CMK032C [Cyanidioschyzon merolae strain 10D]BAM80427.1 hypothetical protein CYME_CMK032C [Cyanidioschyzon merolae strain 10D]|eukprot:XP_005536463.1 hypothetical protein CYME_CMK032C [Cyanidioschyzon merolae strain 10D]